MNLKSEKQFKLPEYILRSKREYQKNRYANDPVYREKFKEWRAKWREKQRLEKNIDITNEILVNKRMKQLIGVSFAQTNIDLNALENYVKNLYIVGKDFTMKWLEAHVIELLSRSIPDEKCNVAKLLVQGQTRRIDTYVKTAIYYILADELPQMNSVNGSTNIETNSVISLYEAGKLLNVSPRTLTTSIAKFRDCMNKSISEPHHEVMQDDKLEWVLVIKDSTKKVQDVCVTITDQDVMDKLNYIVYGVHSLGCN
jgi:hypothetical protein